EAGKDAVNFASGVTFEMPEADTSYTFTVIFLKDTKAVAQSTVTGTSKEEASQGGSTPEALIEGKAANKGSKAKEITLVATKVAAVDYNKVKITAKKGGAGADVALKTSASTVTAYEAGKDAVNFASGVTFEMPEADTSYTFTIELIKGSATVAKSSVVGTSKE
ncbi:MAG: hypothetical protein ACTTH7_07165, partial [Treponema sp.]